MYYLQFELSVHDETATENMDEESNIIHKYFLDITCNKKEYFLLHMLYNTHKHTQ